MEYICKPTKLQIYVNTANKTMAQVKAETGCDAIINGGLFESDPFRACRRLRVDDKTIMDDGQARWGLAWDVNIVRCSQKWLHYHNFICCTCIVRDGKPESTLDYTKDMSGARQRTAMGVFADDRVWLYATHSPTTPEQLRQIALDAGVKHALMVDGGFSTQCIFPHGTLTSSREPYNFICVWAEKEEMPDIKEDSTMIKIGHASVDERGGASGGAAGDSTTKEVCTRSWYNGNWNVVLRPKNADLAEKSAKACEAACANDKIGYDQGQRNTLYTLARAVNFDLSKITTACETDCSALMHVCAIAGGANLTYGSNGLVTWNMVNAFMATGQYEKLTDSKYLTADTYLKRGDVLVRESGHTAMVLENGAQNTTQTGANTMNVNFPLLAKGSEGKYVYMLQALLKAEGYSCGTIDGDFGNKTDTALRNYQRAKKLSVDGKAGKETWGSLLK